MQFDSITFILFIIIVIAAYQLTPNWTGKKAILLTSSYLFYAAWSPPLILLLWFSTLVDFVIAQKIAKTTNKSQKKILLCLSITTNLGLLSYFKYASLLLDTFSQGLSAIGITYSAPTLDIILPIGISFYTFQTLSYTIDTYRGNIQPSKNLLDFSLYVTFFPQLVAGPIVRAGDFLPQLQCCKSISKASLVWGSTLFIWGIFQKVVLSDHIFAPISDNFFSHHSVESLLGNWLALFSFSMQIYCDFAGYSLCAIGTAIIFGLNLPDNFHSPYAAISFSDFWRRWHMTLSQWLRDYLYVPLGGNQHSYLKTLRNLCITMCLGGLWHGASWNFLFWGLAHGLCLVIERLLKKSPIKLPILLRILIVFVLVSLLWIPFRSENTATSLYVVLQLFNTSLPIMHDLTFYQYAAIISLIIILLYQYFSRNHSLDATVKKIPHSIQAGLVVIILTAIALFSTGDSRAFIYFQF